MAPETFPLMYATARAYLLCGPSLAGKSRACRWICAQTGATAISADEINRERGLPFGAEGLPDSVWAETFEIQLARLRRDLGRGTSVVVDDTLCFRFLRDRLREEARAAGAEPVLLLFAPSPRQILDRHARLRASAERPVLSLPCLREHLRSFEWPAAEEAAVDVTTPERLAAWLRGEAARRGAAVR